MTTVFYSLKSQIAHVTNENAELQRSLEFSLSEVTDLKAKSDCLKEKFISLGDNISGRPTLESKIRMMEDWIRRKNFPLLA